jgi:Uma2 family endonuclease
MISSITDFGEILKTTFFEKAITLDNISWQDYKILQSVIEFERPRMKMSLLRENLTILSSFSSLHELIKLTIEGLISTTMLETRTNIISVGQATMRSVNHKIATEPDASYYIQNADFVELKDYVPDEIDLVPDLVVEIDRNHSFDDKVEIYAAFGIKEFWLYSREVLHIFRLTETGEYLEAEKSAALPILSAKVLTDFINRSQKEEQFKVLSEFQNWVVENKQ